jgi:hypothetical protein
LPTDSPATIVQLQKGGADSPTSANSDQTFSGSCIKPRAISRKERTFTLSELIDVELHDLMEAGIMHGLNIERDAVTAISHRATVHV